MATVKSRSALVLAGLLAAGAAALMPATEAAARSQAPAVPLRLGLYQSSNDAQYSFPMTPAYAIQYYGWCST